MTLEDLLTAGETITVKTKDGEASFTVRGLTLPAILQLVKDHRAVLSRLFDEVKENGTEGASFEDMVAPLIGVAPDLIGDVISLCSEGEVSPALARRLPVSVQVEALTKIGNQTFIVEGGLGKTLETVVTMFRGTTDAIQGLLPAREA